MVDLSCKIWQKYLPLNLHIQTDNEKIQNQKTNDLDLSQKSQFK